MAVRTLPVTIEVKSSVKLDDGLVLPAGQYPGKSKETSFANISKGVIEWTTPRYYIDLSAEDLVSMGVKVNSKLAAVEKNVTQFVRTGEVEVYS